MLPAYSITLFSLANLFCAKLASPARSQPSNAHPGAVLTRHSNEQSNLKIFREKSLKDGVLFDDHKMSIREPPFTTQFTTTSPRFTTTKHPEIRKTPSKNHIDTPTTFSRRTCQI
jgi:hypothetical protein